MVGVVEEVALVGTLRSAPIRRRNTCGASLRTTSRSSSSGIRAANSSAHLSRSSKPSSARISSANDSGLPGELAELQVKAQAAETDLVAKANFSARAESMGIRPALIDFNWRIFRQANTIDDWYARAVWKTYATAAYYSTLIVNEYGGAQIVIHCKHCERMYRERKRPWTDDLGKDIFVYCKDDSEKPNLCVNCWCVIYGGERFIGIERSVLSTAASLRDL
jgi:hypothetical protein